MCLRFPSTAYSTRPDLRTWHLRTSASKLPKDKNLTSFEMPGQERHTKTYRGESVSPQRNKTPSLAPNRRFIRGGAYYCIVILGLERKFYRRCCACDQHTFTKTLLRQQGDYRVPGGFAIFFSRLNRLLYPCHRAEFCPRSASLCRFADRIFLK